MAVCLVGAALCNPGNGGALFARLLAQVPSTARFLVSVVCGNHVYNNRFGDAMHFAVEGFGAEARGRSLTHFAVVGMPRRHGSTSRVLLRNTTLTRLRCWTRSARVWFSQEAARPSFRTWSCRIRLATCIRTAPAPRSMPPRCGCRSALRSRFRRRCRVWSRCFRRLARRCQPRQLRSSMSSLMSSQTVRL